MTYVIVFKADCSETPARDSKSTFEERQYEGSSGDDSRHARRAFSCNSELTSFAEVEDDGVLQSG